MKLLVLGAAGQGRSRDAVLCVPTRDLQRFG